MLAPANTWHSKAALPWPPINASVLSISSLFPSPRALYYSYYSYMLD